MDDLAAMLVEIRRRSPGPPPLDINPLEAIYRRCERLPRENRERVLLERLAIAILQGGPRRFEVSDVSSLSPGALSLLDALIERTVSRGYTPPPHIKRRH